MLWNTAEQIAQLDPYMVKLTFEVSEMEDLYKNRLPKGVTLSLVFLFNGTTDCETIKNFIKNL